MVSRTMQPAEEFTEDDQPAFTLQGRLRAARAAANMTQVDVAKALGWPQSRVSKIEMAEYRRPRFEDVVRLARLYGREVGYFSVVVE